MKKLGEFIKELCNFIVDYIKEFWADYHFDSRFRFCVNLVIECIIICGLLFGWYRYVSRSCDRYIETREATIQEALENHATIIKDGQEISEDNVCFDWIKKVNYDEAKNILYIEYK